MTTNVNQSKTAIKIAKSIKKPPPRLSPSDGYFAEIPETMHGIMVNAKDVDKPINASLRFVKFWFVTIAEIKKAINTSKNIISIGNVCYIHLIYSPIKPYGTIKDASVKATAAIFIGVVWAFSIMYAQRIKNAVFAINMSGAVVGDFNLVSKQIKPNTIAMMMMNPKLNT